MTSWGSVLIYMLAGMVLSAPCGPLGMMGMRHRQLGRRQTAYALATGVIVADGLLTLLATVAMAYGGDVFASIGLRRGLGTLVGLGLLGLASMIYLARDKPPVTTQRRQGLQAAAVGLLLTVINPADALSFVAVFGWLHSSGVPVLTGPALTAELVALVMLGTLALWLLWLEMVPRLRLPPGLQWIPRHGRELTAAALGVVGVMALGRAWS